MTVASFMAYAPGKYFNPDNAYGFQCKDLIDSYCMDIFPGKSWVETILPGNANESMYRASEDYFEKIWNDDSNVDQIPQYGDIICWGGNANNGFGHIAIVISADQHGVNVLMQDGFSQCAAFQTRLGYDNAGTGMVQGWLRPRIAGNAKPETGTVHLPASVGSWNVYNENGPYTLGNQVGVLNPSLFGGITYHILGWKAGNSVAIIQTRDFGKVGIYVANGTGAVIS